MEGKTTKPSTRTEEGSVESKGRNQLVPEMGAPAAKRVCSTLASAVRKIAVEGNIGEWLPQPEKSACVVRLLA